MEDIYGAQNSKCPLKPEDQDYSRYCFLKSMADQWFMGPYLRAEENCESSPIYCYSLNKKTNKNHFDGSPVADWVNADHADDLIYVFGYPFLGEELLLPEKQSWQEDEKR